MDEWMNEHISGINMWEERGGWLWHSTLRARGLQDRGSLSALG